MAKRKKEVSNKKDELPLIEVNKINTEIKEEKVLAKPPTITSADESNISIFQTKLEVADEFVCFDFTKAKIKEEDFQNLYKTLAESKFPERVEEMFNGGNVNFTENRPVLHVALRDHKVLSTFSEIELSSTKFSEIHNELEKMRDFTEILHTEKLKGVTGKPIDTVVNIGIGGSDLGPRVVCEALSQYSSHIKVHFVSNVDPSELKFVMEQIDPEKSMFIVVSKTFTTQETLANAKLALQIMEKRLAKFSKVQLTQQEIANKHFVAVSANTDEVSKFGIDVIFQMWDFVGGRYSLWSAAGLSICLYLGFPNFLRLLNGANIVDKAFRLDPMNSLPTIQALIEIWYNQNEYSTKCIVPYDFYLRNLYLHIQQLEMESNGKWSDKHKTGMIIWGGVGTNSQHSFFQLLHQGTHKILTEFLCPLVPNEECSVDKIPSMHSVVVANCLAQAEALMVGAKNDDPHRNFPGNKPSITICYSKLTPEILGALIAHCEHKVFVQGHFWKINSFDQFGVELGKKIAKNVLESINNKDEILEGYSESTKTLIKMAIDAKKEEIA